MDNILDVIIYWQDWFNKQEDFFTNRDEIYKSEADKDFALAYIGVRRCGKTYISCKQARENSKKIFYINFEDPFFLQNNQVNVLDDLLENFTEHYGFEPELLVLDEIQNITAWEKWLRKQIDSKKYKIIITGSSAKLLGSELSSSLTGRSLEKKVFPLSYKEFLSFNKTELKLTNNEHLAQLKKYFDTGGFPAVVLAKDEFRQRDILEQYFTDIVYKDIIARYQIRDVNLLNKIIQFYLTNISSTHSHSSIKKAFGANIATVQDYSSYCENAFLLFFVDRYQVNLKVQTRSPQKVYAIDSGLRNLQSLSEDYGKIAENIVFLELLRRKKQIFYHKENFELNFLVLNKNQIEEAIQVSYSNFDDENTLKRELEGILEACKLYKLESATIISKNRHEILKIDKKKITIKPLYEFLLE